MENISDGEIYVCCSVILGAIYLSCPRSVRYITVQTSINQSSVKARAVCALFGSPLQKGHPKINGGTISILLVIINKTF